MNDEFLHIDTLPHAMSSRPSGDAFAARTDRPLYVQYFPFLPLFSHYQYCRGINNI